MTLGELMAAIMASKAPWDAKVVLEGCDCSEFAGSLQHFDDEELGSVIVLLRQDSGTGRPFNPNSYLPGR